MYVAGPTVFAARGVRRMVVVGHLLGAMGRSSTGKCTRAFSLGWDIGF